MSEYQPASTRDLDVVIPTRGASLPGHLRVPNQARGMVVFAHGSGSSRHSPRNRHVADVLYESGLGTLLFDLLTVDEERDRANVFDIELLAERLVDATRWLRNQGESDTPIGFFGASTGAGAALWASVEADVAAVVSRGGRPDLAAPRLGDVAAPTLLIVGGNDPTVIDLNRQALAGLRCPGRLTVIPGATHLFEEPGALEQVAEHARDWFIRYLGTGGTGPAGLGRSAPDWDAALDRAREDAEGATVFGASHTPAELLVEREEAEGVEVFESPETIASPEALKEGSPGHETYSADQIGLDRDDEHADGQDRAVEREAGEEQ